MCDRYHTQSYTYIAAGEVDVKQFREISSPIFGSVASSPHTLLFGNNTRTNHSHRLCGHPGSSGVDASESDFDEIALDLGPGARAGRLSRRKAEEATAVQGLKGRRFSEVRFGRCPLWVISGHSAKSDLCPLYPQKRTSITTAGMSALCQKRTSACEAGPRLGSV